ncbi:MAG: SURF1 family protein [Colwellia sp.]|nr:SURF1 family protein [Colwellia sp.]MCW8864247.1 SURF1 family protein [Colwellia sp.]MCW9082386.1 SURF1 family protein [Colwellia sp.]
MPSTISSNNEEKRTSYFNKLNLLWLVVTVLVFSALVKLGFWQSARALEKEQRLAQIEKLSAQRPLSLEQVVTLANDSHAFTEVNDYPVFVDGEFDKAQVFLLDNQVNKGRLGYRAYQVAVTNKYAVLVNLGWLQGSVNRQELPAVTALDGQQQFKGHIRFIEQGILLQEQSFDQDHWPLRVQQIELDKFSALIGRQLLPFVIYLDKNESLGFDKNWQPIVMPPEKHRGYAFQWFSLALAWLLLMLWAKFGVKNNNKNKKAV